MKTKACHCCNGKGIEIDRCATGAEMLRLRLKSGVTQAAVAEYLEYTPAYISDLEHGKRAWRKELVDLYKRAIKACQ